MSSPPCPILPRCPHEAPFHPQPLLRPQPPPELARPQAREAAEAGEAGAAEDAETEAVVTEALQRLMKGRSALVIAHRLSTVRDAHAIVVMVGGKVEEKGTHEELLGRPEGVYANLVHRQLDAGGSLRGPA